MYRQLYKNEYRFTSDFKEAELEDVSLENIKIQFPSPSWLVQTNLLERAENADRIAEQFARILVPLNDINDQDRKIFEITKSLIYKKEMSGTNWKDYEDIAKAARVEYVKLEELNKVEIEDENDMNGNYY